MGNSGSVHNINWDSSAGGAFANGRSKSELNGYYQHQRSRHNQTQTQDNETQTQILLRRQQNSNLQKNDRMKSLPSGQVSEQFKVLPKIAPETERLKLRPTTNGMLLNAGGTISGRNKDDIMRVPGLMQRSRTLIFDQHESNEDSKENSEIKLPLFQRSQTLLNINYKERDNVAEDVSKKFVQKSVYKRDAGDHHIIDAQKLRHALSEPDFRSDLNKPTHVRQDAGLDSTNVPTSTNLNKSGNKLNKYNKKRKAPAAPNIANVASMRTTKAENFGNGEKTQITRRFRTNTNANTRQQQQQQQQAQQSQPHRQQQQQQIQVLQSSQQNVTKTSAYRREKSCDAILLRSKVETTVNTLEKHYSYGANAPVSHENKTSQTAINTKPAASPLPKQISKIPQLKRTFYFGMQSNGINETKLETVPPKLTDREHIKQPEKVKEQSHTLERLKETKKDQTILATPPINADDLKDEEFNTLKYKLHRDTLMNGSDSAENLIDEESRIDDNGILLHIRPSLPRRQLEVPSFSPAAAWRMLVNAEEERHRQLQRSSSNALTCESPIQLRHKKLSDDKNEQRQKCAIKTQKNLSREQLHTMTWTPQQDLEDDDDDDDDEGANNVVDTSSSDDYDGDKDEEDGLLFFNGRTKKGRLESSNLKGNEKNSSIGIHLFSLSLPRDSHLEGHMQKKNSVSSNGNDKINNFSSLQKLKLTISGVGNKCTCRASITKLTTGNGESSTDLEVCDIHNNQLMYRSDNWVLHKNGTKDGASNIITSNCGKLFKEDLTPTVEPISLSFLTAGKHVMYLPGLAASGNDKEDNMHNVEHKETTASRETIKTTTRPRQRKRETRESLQDETPIFRHHQSQAQTPHNSNQRFSFQSTVRLLEKRRLAEKLSRDAEIREAQRKSELEAMKRVEEDFQRKRASEKANIRHQLRLYCSGSVIETTHDQYNSLPAYSNRQQHDSNNNKIGGRRIEPEGAAASPSHSPFVVDVESPRFVHQISHLPLKRMDSDCGDSDIDDRNVDITHFNRTASMVEPYLQSFMK